MTRAFFEGYDEDTRRFYSRVFNTCMLNLHACRRGFFDVLLCETEDPTIMIRWREAVPQIVHMIQEENKRGI